VNTLLKKLRYLRGSKTANTSMRPPKNAPMIPTRRQKK
jgi:hypothetical protein